MNMALPQNGTIGTSWLQTSVQSFFGAVNWEDNSPEVQELKRSLDGSEAPSLTLSVHHFFAAINWDDATIAAATAQPEPAAIEEMTLEDFFSQF